MLARSSITRAPLLMAEGTFVKFSMPAVAKPEELTKFPGFPQFGWLKAFREFGLQGKAYLFSNRNDFRDCHIGIPHVRPI